MNKNNNNYYDLDKMKNFELLINNSLIKNKPRKFTTCVLNKRELVINVSSLYFPDVDGEEIIIPFKKLISNSDDTHIEIGYIGNSYGIVIRFTLDKRKKDICLLKLIGLIKEDSLLMDTIPHMKHMYGSISLLTLKELKKLKVQDEYYIILGHGWAYDFKGDYNIYLLDYRGYEVINNEMELRGDLYRSSKNVRGYSDSDLIRADISDPNPIFVIGGGDYPVYIINNFRKGFMPPKMII